MDDKQKKKLEALLEDRAKKMENIRRFDEYFEKFSRLILKEVVQKVNSFLESSTQENLKLLYDNPYHIQTSRYFVMLQMIYGIQYNSYYFNQSESYPSLIFEGDETTGKVKVSMKSKSSTTGKAEIDVSSLTDDKVFEIIVDFIEFATKH